MTREELESALDAGKLEVFITGEKWQKLRRNGKTQTWKTRPGDFRIPVKYGFRGTGQIYHDTPEEYLRISPTKSKEGA